MQSGDRANRGPGIGGRGSKTSNKTCTSLVRKTIRGTAERIENTIHVVSPEARRHDPVLQNHEWTCKVGGQ